MENLPVEENTPVTSDISKVLARSSTPGVTSIVDVASLPNADVHILADVSGSPPQDRTAATPSLDAEHKAKQAEGQEKLAGFGVVPPESRPPAKK
jgi:hypothetical protein